MREGGSKGHELGDGWLQRTADGRLRARDTVNVMIRERLRDSHD